MTRQSPPWDALFVIAMILIASVCAQAQAAQDNDGTEKGTEADTQTDVAEEPTYWIGIHGRSIESAVLRTHLQLAEDMGVVIEKIVDDSPAAKAGLRKHDILLRVNGDAVDNMRVLQSQVRASKEKPLELTIIRLGKQEKISLVPEVLPKEFAERQREASRPFGRFNGRRLQGDEIQDLFEQLGMRGMGPGMNLRVGGQGVGFNQLQITNGVTISIRRNNDGPAQITVQQGDKTWQIAEDDAEAIKELPDEVRPHVERMLQGQNNRQGFGGALGGGFDMRAFEAEMEGVLPRGLGGFDGFEGLERGRPGELQRRKFEQQDPLRKRMEQLEKRLQQLHPKTEKEDPELLQDQTT